MKNKVSTVDSGCYTVSLQLNVRSFFRGMKRNNQVENVPRVFPQCIIGPGGRGASLSPLVKMLNELRALIFS